MKKTVLLSFITGVIFGSASEALACGSCGYILFDRVLPPMLGWVALPVLWSFALSIYSASTGAEIWGSCRPVSWLILVFILFITSIMFTGPLFLLFLMLPGIILSIKVFLPFKSYNNKVKKELRIISAAGITAFISLIIMTAIIQNIRTEADFILKYENSGPAKMALKRLTGQTPGQLNHLREIVLKGKNSQIVATACEGIATHGDPFQDVPLLLNVYQKNYGKDDDEKIESALSKLTGLALPEGSLPEEWKRNWNLKADRGAYYSKSNQ